MSASAASLVVLLTRFLAESPRFALTRPRSRLSGPERGPLEGVLEDRADWEDGGFGVIGELQRQVAKMAVRLQL